MNCCKGEVKELLGNCHSNDCGCGEQKCEPLFDIASPIEGQILRYSEEFKAFVNVMPTKLGLTNGTGTPIGLGSICPAIDPTTPYAWIQFKLSDGSTVYMPAWK